MSEDTDLVRVFRVSSSPAAKGLTQYVIDTTLVALPTRSLQLQTVNAYAASLCQRAKDLGKPIAVTHKPTPYGETLTKAHFLTTEQVA